MFGMRPRQPVPGPGAVPFGTLHATDRRCHGRGEQAVVRGLEREFPEGAQLDVDRSRRKPPLFELCAEALHGRFVEFRAAGRVAPLMKLIQRLAVGALRVGGSDAVENERLNGKPRVTPGGRERGFGRRRELFRGQVKLYYTLR